MKNTKKIKWFKEPEDHDYPAAESYLSLIYPESVANGITTSLKKKPISMFKAKDVFRASKLSLLGVSNSHVKKNLTKISKGEKMSPILLVRDSKTSSVIIADGYHRMCAVYQLNEDEVIPCQIVTQ